MQTMWWILLFLNYILELLLPNVVVSVKPRPSDDEDSDDEEVSGVCDTDDE